MRISNALAKIAEVQRSGRLLTPQIDRWLLTNREGPVLNTPYLQEKVLRILSTTPQGRHASFHCSALLNVCERAQVFGFLNVPPISKELDGQLSQIFNDGKWRHLRIQVTMMNAGVIDDFEVGVRTKNGLVTGSMDGLKRGEYNVEIKGTSRMRAVKTEGAIPAHVNQVHPYMYLGELDRAVIYYEDKMTQEAYECVIDRDDKIIRRVKVAIEDLVGAVKSRTLPKVLEECKRGKGPTFRGCPYSHYCLGCGDYEEAAEDGQRRVKVKITRKAGSHTP